MSIFFISHDLGVINEVADRIYVMKEGKIVEGGDKNDIINHPTHPYTKRLLDAIPKIKIEEVSPLEKGGIFIDIQSVSKRYPIERGPWRRKTGEITAVDNVSLALKRGKTLGLVGESACGKTTLGRLILGLIKPDSGRILIDGKTLDECLKTAPTKIRRMMQIVFQDPYSSLDPHMRMRDIVLEGPCILGVQRIKKEGLLKDILSKVHLRYEDRFKFPHQFSAGERQRIAIARALAVEPKFLVLDEPVSSLDVSIQADILDLLKVIQKKSGLTYLFISHDLRVVGSISDEVAVMHNGRIVESGTKDTIYNSPQDPYTKRLLNSIPHM